MSFGKYKGKEVAWVLLDDPNYFFWMKGKGMNERGEYQFVIKLISTLDSMPYSCARCMGECKGKNIVTRLSLYNGKYNGQYWFCDSCDPYHLGANRGKLSTLKTFNSVFGHSQAELIIKAMASAKGSPQRKTQKALKTFFGY